MFVLVLSVLFNLFVAIWNARICGYCWDEAKAEGGWGRLVIWCGAIQSALGFSIVYLCGLAGLATLFVADSQLFIGKLLAFSYLLMIIPAIGTGLIILVHSWIEAFKRRDFASIGTAALNSASMYSNVSGASHGIEAAGNIVADMFDDEDGWVAGVVVVVAAITIGSGIATTYWLLNRYRGKLSGYLAAGAE